MFAPPSLPHQTPPPALALAIQAALAGGLGVLAVLCVLAARPLQNKILRQAGAFGLLMAVLPWAFSHRLAEAMLGLLAPGLAWAALSAGFQARGEGRRAAGALMAGALALLVGGATLWAQAAGWIGPAVDPVILQLEMAGLATALGWALLSQIGSLRRMTDAAQVTTITPEARDLEVLVEERSAELSARVKDLGEARRTAELANQGLQRALDQLEQVASTDRLTGAWNRHRFEEAVLPEIALAHRRRDALSLIMFDLDHFKRVNDTFGHATGDVVLVGAAQTVRQHLRATDALVRWGGEEFLVMAPATRLDGAMGLAEKLRMALASLEFPGVGHVTMSLGVAEYALGESLAEWIERVDQALYRAKAGGRNRTEQAPTPDRPGSEPAGEHSLLEVFWEETYESGNALIDAQHQRLFRLASALMSVIAEDRPIQEISFRLETLMAHTAQHFHDEEALLRESRYPNLAAHSAIHAALLDKARDLQAQVQAGQLNVGNLITFLALDLVKKHILMEDRGYFPHLPALAGSEETPPAGA